MIVGNGRPVFSGIAIGRAYVYKKGLATLPASCGDAAAEQQKFEDAKQTALEQLQTLMEETAERLGEEQAMILDVQMMMLDDQDYLDSIAASVTALATEQDYIKTDVKEIKSDVKSLTAKPGKRWEGIVDKIIYVVVGALVAWALSHFGL